MEVLLWLLFLLPGLVYSLWRLMARRDVCGLCGAAELLPVESPRGRELAARSRAAMPPVPPAPPAPPARPPSRAAYKMGRWLGGLFGKR